METTGDSSPKSGSPIRPVPGSERGRQHSADLVATGTGVPIQTGRNRGKTGCRGFSLSIHGLIPGDIGSRVARVHAMAILQRRQPAGGEPSVPESDETKPANKRTPKR